MVRDTSGNEHGHQFNCTDSSVLTKTTTINVQITYHHSLHAVHSTDEMREVDGAETTDSDEQVFVEIRHTQDFMWHHLSPPIIIIIITINKKQNNNNRK